MRKAIVISCVLVLCGCARQERFAEQPPLRVEVSRVGSSESIVTSRYVARVEEGSSVPLSLPAGGRVTEVLCRVGDRVQAQQVLVRVDDTQARQSLQAAEASLRTAQDGYNRARQVYKEGGITEQKMVEIESKLTQARSVAASTKKMFEDCTLRAPSAGTIGRCDIQKGQTVAPAVTVVTVIDVNALNIVFTVPEREIGNIRIGDSAIAEVPAAGVTDLPIVITEKSLIANRVAHTYEVKGLVKSPALLPGMAGTVSVNAQNEAQTVIPYHCVTLLQDGPTVWVARDSIAERRPITTGAATADGVVVTSGLSEGDLVITEGFHKLYNGAKVTY